MNTVLGKTKHRKGSSLVLLIVLVSALVFVTSTSFIQTDPDLDEGKAQLTTMRYESIKQSLLGPSTSVSLNGQAIQSGFISDNGKLPTGNSLSDLAVPSDALKPWGVVGGNLAKSGGDYFTDTILPQISIYDGWRGPYSIDELNGLEPAKDGWGHHFQFALLEDNGFNNGGLMIYSQGKGAETDTQADHRGYEDDYPFEPNEKTIASEEYTVPIHELPQNLEIQLGPNISEDQLCNYYIGLIYPGVDLSQASGGTEADSCGGGGGAPGPGIIPDGEFKPSPGSYFDGSVSKSFPSINNQAEIRAQLQVNDPIGRNGNNVNQGGSNTDPANFSGVIRINGEPEIRINGDRSRFDENVRIEGSTGNITGRDRFTINGDVQIEKFVFNSPPQPVPPLKTPLSPTGYRNENLNSPNDSLGDQSTLRGFNVNGGYGDSDILLEPGRYDNVSVNSGTLVLGDPNATEPSIYSFKRLNINSQASLRVDGPVEIILPDFINFQTFIGNADHPEWMLIHLSGNHANFNSNTVFYGSLIAPNATVHLNNNTVVTGSLYTNKLGMNSGSKILNGYLGGTEYEPEQEEQPTPIDPPTNPTFDFSPPGEELVSASLADLVRTPEGRLKLRKADGTKLYFNKPLARRYNIVIYKIGLDNGLQAVGTLASQMAYVHSKVYSFNRGTNSTLTTSDTQTSGTEVWRIGQAPLLSSNTN